MNRGVPFEMVLACAIEAIENVCANYKESLDCNYLSNETRGKLKRT